MIKDQIIQNLHSILNKYIIFLVFILESNVTLIRKKIIELRR